MKFEISKELAQELMNYFSQKPEVQFVVALQKLKTIEEINSTPLSWIDVDKSLPPMFKNVIVWGLRKNENVMEQAYQARRWTGVSSGMDVEKEKAWVWATPCDHEVVNVTHWYHMYDKPPEETP